ncbi:hypothetical protein Goari_021320 [Gossypium aridum]|uniref:Uncharacterized protein n=1 Tax=Gossypium aridum TaxID=34290 RepID=A0A7J8YDZ1_GOSAI|nr:hypothetical protein [Gossypium aridum]
MMGRSLLGELTRNKWRKK